MYQYSLQIQKTLRYLHKIYTYWSLKITKNVSKHILVINF